MAVGGDRGTSPRTNCGWLILDPILRAIHQRCCMSAAPSRLLVYYAHPGHRFSHANAAMWGAAQEVSGISTVDLYAEYPRHNIDIDAEQARLLEHEIILFQCPLFWYSTPSIIKEWEDLVLEHGFAYGHDGDKLAGKTMIFALTAAGPEDAYSPDGYQHYPLRTFLTPLERTAGLCKMRFAAPYVLFGSLRAAVSGETETHAAGYRRVLEAMRDGKYDFDHADQLGVVQHADVDALVMDRP